MIKKTKPVILLVIFLLSMQISYGQLHKNMPDFLRQKFLSYTEIVPREEIYVHSDREEYIAGEDLWFSLYLIDRQSFMPSLNSRIVYIELLNYENRPVVQKKILVDKGLGPGQILLPDSLSSGTYTLRAYTSWMKNFLPYNCFMKDIKVYNVFSKNSFRAKKGTDNILNSRIGTNDIRGNENSRLSLKVNNLNTDTLEIYVSTDISFRSQNSNIIYLFIQSHGLINCVRSEKVLSEISRILIPKNELIPGVNQITVFDSKGKPVGERFIFLPVREKHVITLNTIESFKKRSHVSLEIESENDLSSAVNSNNLSISVTPVTNSQGSTDINNYLTFGTEFGLPYQGIFNCRNISELPANVIDSILLNVKSNWINWEKILSDDLPNFKYLAEKEDHFLLGKLLTGDQEKSQSSEFLVMCTPGKEASFQYAATDDNGNFSFRINIDEELKALIIMPDKVDPDQKIIIESSFSDQYLQHGLSDDTSKNQEPPYISEWSANYQVKKIYGISNHGNPINPSISPIEPLRFYGKPDIELIMADYISLPKMEEVFFELLPRVYLKKKKTGYEISIADRVDDSRYVLSPSLFIDGVIIKNPSDIADLDPEIVERIDVIKEIYMVGRYAFYGIVNVITKAGNFSCIALPDHMIRIPYRVIDPVFSFISPDYSSLELKKSRIPDFRNTLYWSPSVKTDKSKKIVIDFWTSDVISDYEINIQGFDSEGKPVSGRKIIRVE